MTETDRRTAEEWPDLPLDAWQETYDTLHLWTQMVGKIKLRQTPLINHWWNTTLTVTPRGLTTRPISCGHRIFQIDFDFLDSQLRISTSDGAGKSMALAPKAVADFYQELAAIMDALDLPVAIWTMPVEMTDAIPFDQDRRHSAYDADAVQRFWRILVNVGRVFEMFRSRFIGKCSPVHFFWGSFDLAVSRFSGRRAPVHPGNAPNLADWVVREAYSHEVSSCGFWPGSGTVAEPAFYAYAYPEPPGFKNAAMRPDAAFYSQEFSEFILPYAAVRTAQAPDQMLLSFLQDTYALAADLAHWDRAALERDPAWQP